MLCALCSGARRCLNLCKQYALVFFREEGGRDTGEQEHHANHNQHISQQVRSLVPQNAADTFFIAFHAIVEGPVEPAEETALVLAVITLLDRLEHGGAQGRGEDQGNQYRQAHRRNDSDRELAIDHTRGAAEEGHRQQYRRQHQGNTHQGTLDLLHGFLGRFLGRQSLFGHDPLNVFNHHDRIVHQQADGQYHTEHGQGVDAEACSGQDPEGTQQYNRYCHRGDDGGAEVLQEQEHHQEHQDNSFDQGVNHTFDRGRNHRRGVVWVNDFHAFREEGFQAVDGFTQCLCRVQGVGARGQLDRDTRCRFTVELRADAVVFTTQGNICDIAQAYLGAVGVDLEQDLFELFSRLQTGFADDGRVQLLTLDGRQAAQLPGGHLHVLCADGRLDVHRRQVVLVQLDRVEPDTHGVLGAEHLEVAHTFGTGDRVLHVGNDVVGQVVLVHAAVFRHHANNHQEVFHCLGYTDTLLLYLLR